MRKNLVSLLIGILAFTLITAIPVYAATQPASGDQYNFANRGNFTQPAPESVNVQSGFVYYADINGSQGTYLWTGMTGNVSGELVLADASNDNFYQWSGAKGVLVYACTDVSPDWANIAAEDGTNVPAFLSGTMSDSYDNTFTATRGFPSNIFTGITTDYTTTLSTGATNWYLYAINDGVTPLWVSEVVDAGTGYNGDTVDYQLMLPEDGSGGDEATTQYYLWLELE